MIPDRPPFAFPFSISLFPLAVAAAAAGAVWAYRKLREADAESPRSARASARCTVQSTAPEPAIGRRPLPRQTHLRQTEEMLPYVLDALG